jgi:uncharacterized Fe-S cluster protein YjdI
METKHYISGDLKVSWTPSVCTHSTNCWKGLISVFNPRRKPWIDLTQADKHLIIKQVDKCPSKALTWEKIVE